MTQEKEIGRAKLLLGLLRELAAIDAAFVAWLLERRAAAEPEVRCKIAMVLSHSPLLPSLLSQRAVASGDPGLHLVNYLLGEPLHPQRLDLVPLCRRALHDADEGVRCGALLALQRLGPAAQGMFEELQQVCLTDPSELNRELAALALAAIDRSRARATVMQLSTAAQSRGEDVQRFEPWLRAAYRLP